MEKKYEELIFNIGDDIDSVIRVFNFWKSRGILTCGEFNGVMLYSDIDDIDSAYEKILGKSKSDVEKSRQEWLDNVRREEIEQWVSHFQEHLSDELIVEPDLIKVYINGIFKGYHNEYTCRNLQVQVKKGLLQGEVKLINSNEIEVTIGKNGKLIGNKKEFIKGSYDVSNKLVYELIGL